MNTSWYLFKTFPKFLYLREMVLGFKLEEVILIHKLMSYGIFP
jgi:hypothetical protein